MIKRILNTMALGFAMAAAATAQADGLTALECTGTRNGETVTFDIVGWGTPNAVLYLGAGDRDGAGLVSQEQESASGVARLVFSNECDNLFVLLLGPGAASDAGPQQGVADFYTEGRRNEWSRLALTCSWNRNFVRDLR